MVETRLSFIRRVLRQIYGGIPSIDSNITDNLVNRWIQDGFCAAAKNNFVENGQIDGVEYVNNSYYTTYSGLSLSASITEDFCYVFTAPDIPVGLGANQGIGTVRFRDSNGNISQEAIPLTINQVGYQRNMRPIPNKILYWNEGNLVYCRSVLILSDFTAIVKMVSSGNFNDLNSNINVPQDAFPFVVEYVKKQLSFERQMVKTPTNDGADA